MLFSSHSNINEIKKFSRFFYHRYVCIWENVLGMIISYFCLVFSHSWKLLSQTSYEIHYNFNKFLLLVWNFISFRLFLPLINVTFNDTVIENYLNCAKSFRAQAAQYARSLSTRTEQYNVQRNELFRKDAQCCRKKVVLGCI